jgi:hypothetical protein
MDDQSASNVGQEPTPPVELSAEPTPFVEMSVTSANSVEYPGPDDLKGHTAPEHNGETTVCPICAHEFVPGEPRP